MLNFSTQDRERLRELADSVRQMADSSINQERRSRWYCHNQGEIVAPPIIVEQTFSEQYLMAKTICRNPVARNFELQMLSTIFGYQAIQDDKVVDQEFIIPMNLKLHLFGIDMNGLRKYHSDENGNTTMAYNIVHPFNDVADALKRRKQSFLEYRQEETEMLADVARECFGDILNVSIKNYLWRWYMGLSARIVEFIGMEKLFFSYLDTPDLTSELYRQVAADMLELQLEQARAGLLQLNNGNDFIGSGSRGFTRDLPKSDYNGQVRLKDLWGNFNSQESIGVSPDIFMTQIYPHYESLASQFGMTYYGCCEDVSIFYDSGLKKLPNLRKISISPWCNEKKMGEHLRNGNVVYSRKPSPNFFSSKTFNHQDYFAHIEQTLKAADGCPLEFILRDIYDIGGDVRKIADAVTIIRRACTKFRRG